MEFPNTLPHCADPEGASDHLRRGGPVSLAALNLSEPIRTGRCAATSLALLSAGATCLGVSALSYAVGRGLDPEMAFLDPRRAPTGNEATIAQAIGYGLRSHEMNVAVFIGDSACCFGIDPKRLPFPAYNLGTQRGVGPSGFLIT